jgi:hypothetical protein
MFNLNTKTGKLYNALVVEGQKLSSSEITSRFGVKNPSATVSDIRHAGFAIYANTRVAKNGVRVTEYSHGRASRKLIAAGYKAIAMGLV